MMIGVAERQLYHGQSFEHVRDRQFIGHPHAAM
jgi:hypothetical protein